MNGRRGLSAAEVAERTRTGRVNRAPRTVLRDYLAIVGRNLFTGFNAMVAPAAVVLMQLQDFRAGVAVAGMAVLNTFLALVQEFRAKIHLDQLTLLSEQRVRALRDGQVVALGAGDVVADDCLLLQAGDTVVADGTLLEDQYLEVDESLLTGESDAVRRRAGEAVLSGSVCVAGEGCYRAEKVGAESFANRTSAEARRLHVSSSPATRVINRVVRWLTYAALLLAAVHVTAYWTLGLARSEVARMVATTITTMVPQGLVLSTTVSFLVGAVAMSRRGALVQRLSAVETMAAVDVVCTDKTGTLTTNRLHFESLILLASDMGEPAVRERLRAFASASIDRTNRNIVAMRDALGPVEVDALDQIPFKSRNRFSAARLRDGSATRLLVLGAVEALSVRLAPSALARVEAELAPLQHRGLRLLLFAEGPGDAPIDGLGALPDVPLTPLALVALGDELRPNVGDVLHALHAQGIAFKVLSGDNPETVQGTVSHLDLPLARDQVVSGDDLAKSADPDTLIAERSVFGRVSPEQKTRIVRTLKAQGRCVAMIGDGVNDVLPIKNADLGIAMGAGTSASKTVSGLVLEGDRFELLPELLEEGRTILRNLRRSGKLFLVKNVYAGILMIAYYLGLGMPFPFVPQQVTLMNWSVIGIPALAIAASRQRSTGPIQGSFFWDLARFALRTGVVIGLVAVTMLCHLTRVYPDDVDRQRTVFLSYLIAVGVLTLLRALRDGGLAQQGDERYALIGLAAFPLYFAMMYLPPTAHFFQLTPLAGEWFWVAFYVGVCHALVLLADRLFAQQSRR